MNKVERAAQEKQEKRKEQQARTWAKHKDKYNARRRARAALPKLVAVFPRWVAQ